MDGFNVVVQNVKISKVCVHYKPFFCHLNRNPIQEMIQDGGTGILGLISVAHFFRLWILTSVASKLDEMRFKKKKQKHESKLYYVIFFPVIVSDEWYVHAEILTDSAGSVVVSLHYTQRTRNIMSCTNIW